MSPGSRSARVTLRHRPDGGRLYAPASRIDAAGLLGVVATILRRPGDRPRRRHGQGRARCSFEASSRSPRDDATTEIEWEGGTPVRVSVVPPRQLAPDPATQGGALDPVSAGFAVLRDQPRRPDLRHHGRCLRRLAPLAADARRAGRRRGRLRLRRHLRPARGRGAYLVEPARISVPADLRRRRRRRGAARAHRDPDPLRPRGARTPGLTARRRCPTCRSSRSSAPLGRGAARRTAAPCSRRRPARARRRGCRSTCWSGARSRAHPDARAAPGRRPRRRRAAGGGPRRGGRAAASATASAASSVPGTRIEVVTEGVLTRMIQSDPELPASAA